MPNWRRACVPGGTFLFTVVTDRRAPLFSSAPARALLGSVLRRPTLLTYSPGAPGGTFYMPMSTTLPFETV